MDGCGEALGGKSCTILVIVSSSSSSSSSQTSAFVRRVSSRGPIKRFFSNSETLGGRKWIHLHPFVTRPWAHVQLGQLLREVTVLTSCLNDWIMFHAWPLITASCL